MKMGTIASPWRYDATFNFARLLPRAYVSRRCCYDDHPDFGWGQRLLPLNALTGHGCINLATGRDAFPSSLGKSSGQSTSGYGECQMKLSGSLLLAAALASVTSICPTSGIA